MKSKTLRWLGAGIAVAVCAVSISGVVVAADHAEAPGTMGDGAADIADFYAWHDNGTVTAIVTFGGLTPAGGDAVYDANVLYGIHIDTDGDAVPDMDIWARFGQDADGNWGLQVQGLPGEDGNVVGAVESNIDGKAWAGLRDDGFFFDLEGFNLTIASAMEDATATNLMFDPTRDSLAGTNVTAIVVSFPGSAVGSDNIQMWATSGRK